MSKAHRAPQADTAVRNPMDAKETAALWRRHKSKPTDESRNRLVERYLPLVRYNAERLHVRLPDEVDVDDLIQAGIFGLLDAIDAFDLDRGVKFETYCAQRIRGAILDELRSMDWVPRLVRSRSHKLNDTAKCLEAELGRKPTDGELAKRLNIGMKEFARLKRDAPTVSVVSLSRTHYQTDNNKDVTELEVLCDPACRNPEEEAQRTDLKDLLTRGLTRAERLILILYYYEEMTMKEIGATLDLSESRVSQMHSAILDRLKGQLGNRHREFAIPAE
ncbi:MAG: RNA polymerase sigma factor FliA [Phycisphaerae bacterium]|nr:RNA polymerase sigma factor FliA [Phycisphaerae bacterium]